VNPIRLEQMAFFDAGAIGLVDIAAELGVPKVSFWTLSQGGMKDVHLVTDDSKRAVKQRLDDSGVVADSIEVFRLDSSPDLDAWRNALEIGAYLGATSAAVINSSLENKAQAADSLAQFALAAEDVGLIPTLEPISRGATRTLAEGENLIRLSGSANVKLAVDVLHLTRTGCSPAAVQAIKPSFIGYAQICDGPSYMPPEGLGDEGGYNRMIPGDGDFPLVEFVAALPADVVIGIEVPMRRLQDQGVSPRDRAGMMIAGTRKIQILAADSVPDSAGSR
jgi:sugar phosphate isomerase/epimerase